MHLEFWNTWIKQGTLFQVIKSRVRLLPKVLKYVKVIRLLPRRMHCIKITNILQLFYFVGFWVSVHASKSIISEQSFLEVENLMVASSKFVGGAAGGSGRGLESMLSGNMLALVIITRSITLSSSHFFFLLRLIQSI